MKKCGRIFQTKEITPKFHDRFGNLDDRYGHQLKDNGKNVMIA